MHGGMLINMPYLSASNYGMQFALQKIPLSICHLCHGDTQTPPIGLSHGYSYLQSPKLIIHLYILCRLRAAVTFNPTLHTVGPSR